MNVELQINNSVSPGAQFVSLGAVSHAGFA